MVFPNTIRRYHIETGKFTIEDVSCNGISKYHSGTVATGKCTIENGKGIEWCSIIMNGISKYHSGIIETGKCTIEDFSDIDWYSIVMNGISKYHHCDQHVYH